MDENLMMLLDRVGDVWGNGSPEFKSLLGATLELETQYGTHPDAGNNLFQITNTAYNDLFEYLPGNNDYTTWQKQNLSKLKALGYDKPTVNQVKSDPILNAHVAAMYYNRRLNNKYPTNPEEFMDAYNKYSGGNQLNNQDVETWQNRLTKAYSNNFKEAEKPKQDNRYQLDFNPIRSRQDNTNVEMQNDVQKVLADLAPKQDNIDDILSGLSSN